MSTGAIIVIILLMIIIIIIIHEQTLSVCCTLGVCSLLTYIYIYNMNLKPIATYAFCGLGAAESDLLRGTTRSRINDLAYAPTTWVLKTSSDQLNNPERSQI